MSDSSSDITGLITQATQIQFARRVITSGTALVFYDYTLTFSTEVSEIWNSNFSGAQCFFFITRYAYIAFTGLYWALIFIQNPSDMLCRVLTFNVAAWNSITQIGLYGILTLRTYAIYQKNQFILVILGLPSAANVAIGVFNNILDPPDVDSSVFGNICTVDESSIISPRLQLASSILSLVIDIVLFTLTFGKTIRHAIEMRKVGLGNGLGYFILRDGAMYFLAKLLIGVASTTVFFVPASVAIGNWLGVVVEISNPLTIILINRLVLNLRQVAHMPEGNTPTLGAIGTIQEPAFAVNSLLGNLGAPLRVGLEDNDEIEEIGIDDAAEVVEEREIVNHTEIIEEPRNPSDV